MARRKKAAAEQELDGLAEDWVALWQSEIAGLMADPELAAAWGAMAAMGNAWLNALAGGLPGGQGGFGRDKSEAPGFELGGEEGEGQCLAGALGGDGGEGGLKL